MSQYVKRSSVVLDAVGSVEIDVSDLENVAIHVEQVVDAGTVTAQVYSSQQGVAYLAEGAAIADTGFPSGANTVIERTLSDSNGMSKTAERVKLTASALAGGGSYRLNVAGHQRGFRG